MTIGILTKQIKLHHRFWGYDNHPEYKITIAFQSRVVRSFLVRELVDHILFKGEQVTVPNLALPKLKTIGCPIRVTVSMVHTSRTTDNLEASWLPEIRVCSARAAEENDHCCASFEFATPLRGQHGRDATRTRSGYFRRAVVGDATFRACKDDPDTEFKDPLWDSSQHKKHRYTYELM